VIIRRLKEEQLEKLMLLEEDLKDFVNTERH